MIRIVVAFLLTLLPAATRADEAYPARTVEVVVPFTPGGGADVVGRVITERLSEVLHQRFVVINRPGASTNIGTATVANAPADGYTLLLASIAFAANPSLYRKLSYAQKDFAPIALIANSPSILVVNPSLPVKSVGELVAYLKAHPGEWNYASYGAGSSAHLAAGLFLDVTGTTMQHVPYSGGGPATLAVLRGEVQMLFSSVIGVGPQILNGGVRPLAIAAQTRSPAFPDVPTLRELGIDCLNGTWFGLLAPAGTAPEIITKLNAAVTEAMRSDLVRRRIAEQGAELVGGSPEDFARFIKEDTDRLSAVIRRANIHLD